MSRTFRRLMDGYREYLKDPETYDAKMALTHDRIPQDNAAGFFWWPKDWK